MRIRKIDTTGDWLIGKGFSNLATGQQAIEENIRTRILSWKNDCFFAMDDHIDWRARLDKGQQNNLLLDLKRVILSSEGVVGIDTDKLTVSLGANRNLTIQFTIDTIYGQNFTSQVTLEGTL